MRLIADLHLHSPFSRATSGRLTPPWLDGFARIKGLDLVGTGDATHPAWLARLGEELEPVEEGFYRLREGVRKDFQAREGVEFGELGRRRVSSPLSGPRFVLSAEVSTIYKAEGKTRKVHHLILLSSLEGARAFQTRLGRLGNIESDGRPILGLDSRDLLEVLLDADPRALLVPAHIWTPWFSALGDKSGFDSIAACYRDLASHIGAIETGLSSNPPMNWALSSLDPYAIISNSDAHSPDKLGREATVLDMEPSYAGLAEALSGAGGGPRGRVAATIEFYPAEGKYHWDGHRACGVVLPPAEATALQERCPVCGKPLTIGVLHRVMELADRKFDETEALAPEAIASGKARKNQTPYHSLVPLRELLGEILGTGPTSKKVDAAYKRLLLGAGSELTLLDELPLDEVGRISRGILPAELFREAIDRVRSGRVRLEPGYDGEYGHVTAFAPGEVFGSEGKGLFGGLEPPGAGGKTRATRIPTAALPTPDREAPASPGAARSASFRPSPEQEAALAHTGGPALVLAGPGSGKTALLVERIARLVEGGRSPNSILALSFSNKSAAELGERLVRRLGEAGAAVLTSTFHALGRRILETDLPNLAGGQPPGTPPPPALRLLGAEEAEFLLERSAAALGGAARGARGGRLGRYIAARRRALLLPGEEGLIGEPPLPGLPPLAEALPSDPALDAAYAAYRASLEEFGALDYDELLLRPLRRLAGDPEMLGLLRARWTAILVDEYQDLDYAQYALVRLLAPGAADSGKEGPFVIGDPDQAIYGFRGADPRFIGRFLEDYPGAAVYRLSRSYRCTPLVLEAAQAVVGGEKGSGPASPSSRGSRAQTASPEPRIRLVRTEAPSAAAEAEGIARRVEALVGGTTLFALDSGSARGDEGLSPGEVAVLVRLGAEIEPIAEALRNHGIPYRLAGEAPWWEEEPARTLVELLRLLSDPGERLLEGLLARKGQEKALARLRELSEEERKRLRALPATEAVATVFGPGIMLAQEELKPGTLAELARRAAPFSSLTGFLASLEGREAQDGLEPTTEALSLLSIHAAKGLEFEAVFVPGLEEGLLPFTLFEDGPERRAEESRLLYVAMTRAKRLLFLSSARKRRLFGRDLALPPSSFLGRIGEDLVEVLADSPPPRRPKDRQLELF